VRHEGTQLTVVATLTMVHHALAAAQALASEGLSVEVIDPRTLVPFDVDTVVASVCKTGRLLVLDEAYLNFGIQAEVIAAATGRAGGAPKAAPRRLGNRAAPVPFAPALQEAVLPGRARIEAASREMRSRRKRAAQPCRRPVPAPTPGTRTTRCRRRPTPCSSCARWARSAGQTWCAAATKTPSASTARCSTTWASASTGRTRRCWTSRVARPGRAGAWAARPTWC